MKLQFNWIGGASFILSIDKLHIAVDPVLCEEGTIQDYFWFKSKRIEQPVFKDSIFKNIDLWLITHNHEDHLDKIGLSKIERSSKVICNPNSLKKLKTKAIHNLTVLKWKENAEYDIKGYHIKIEAIPAIHGINPISAFFAGKVNGYYLTISNNIDKLTIYITGDTVYKKSIIKHIKNKPIDLLIPNMGAAKQGSWIMTLTLNSKMLKKIINKLNPKIVIPVHYGTFEHYKEPLKNIQEINDKRIKIVSVGEKKNIILPHN